MKKEIIQQLLAQPKEITVNSSDALQHVLAQHPYFQSIHALLLKSLYLQESIVYNQALKKTAAYTLDRDILFDFITSEEFTTYEPHYFNQEVVLETPLATTEEASPCITTKSTSTVGDLLNNFSNQSKENITANTATEEPTKSEENNTIEAIESKLQLGKPLQFSTDEKHSYAEWLKLANFIPIERAEEEVEIKTTAEQEKNITLINKFIETNPKILPTKKPISPPINIELSTQENTSLMTETLAKIYLEQKKYQKAIQAYEILILKYPEKSSLFADQILNIKSLQQHNN